MLKVLEDSPGWRRTETVEPVKFEVVAEPTGPMMAPEEAVLLQEAIFVQDISRFISVEDCLHAMVRQQLVHVLEIESMEVAVRGLLHLRDFMGVQLNHSWGNIDDAEFGRQCDVHLSDREGEMTEHLKQTALFLAARTEMDSETLSEVLNVRLDDVHELLHLPAIADEGPR